MRKPLSLFLTLTILCAALTGCTFRSGSTSAASTSAATPDGPTLRLGVYLPQDDPVAEAVYAGAEYALLERPSIELDGVTYSVELYWPSAEDDASLAKKLADSGCAAILGGLDSDACAAAAGTFREASLPMLSLAADDGKMTRKNDLFFSFAPSVQREGRDLAAWALEQELTRGAVIDCITDPYTVDIAAEFARGLEREGKIVATEVVTPDQTDFTEVLNAIKKADAQVVCAPLGLEQGIALLNQAGTLGLDVQWVSGSRWSQDELVRQTGVNCEGVVLPSAYSAGRDEAFETWASTNLSSQSSWPWAAMGHDCYAFLLDAIQQAGPQDGSAIAQALQRVSRTDGLCDTTTVDLRGGVGWNSLGRITVKKGAFQLM